MQTRFENKHVSLNPVSASAAKQASCFRNMNETPRSDRNTVLFGATSLEATYDANADRCASRFSDIYQCTFVERNPNSIHDCSLAFCRSCKTTFPTTTPYYVEIQKDNGHLFYQNVWYRDGGGTWREFSTAACA